MRYQMRIHLFLLAILFLIVYLIFLFLYTTQLYVDYLLDKAQERYDDVLTARLAQSSIALSTVVYYIDKVGIESVMRLTDVFTRVQKEVTRGYFIGNNNSAPNFKLLHQDDIDLDNRYQSMQCLYQQTSPDYTKEPFGNYEEIQTVRVMNRYWTEVINLNIGQSRAIKISQMVIESKSGVFCAYPGVSGQALRNFKKDPQKSFLKAKNNTYWIYRNQ